MDTFQQKLVQIEFNSIFPLSYVIRLSQLNKCPSRLTTWENYGFRYEVEFFALLIGVAERRYAICTCFHITDSNVSLGGPRIVALVIGRYDLDWMS